MEVVREGEREWGGVVEADIRQQEVTEKLRAAVNVDDPNLWTCEDGTTGGARKHQQEFFYAAIDEHRLICADDMGLGKAQPLDAKILTPYGWFTMGEVNVGTKVIGSQGAEVAVMGIYDRVLREVFLVDKTEGTTTDCWPDPLSSVAPPS